MRKLIIPDKRNISPFNEPARELRVMNKPLWLNQRDVLASYCEQELDIISLERMPDDRTETIVYRDNLFFDQPFVDTFMQKAKQQGKACRVAFALTDPAIVTHAAQFQRGIHRQGDVYVADLWYFPFGKDPNVRPLLIETGAREIGYYRVPSYMANESGDLTYQVPLRAFMSIEHWVHLYIANSIFGLFARGARFEQIAGKDLRAKLRAVWYGMIERRQVLRSTAAVKIGKGTIIDPSATIIGPTTIGDYCFIDAGVVIDNSVIGDNVTVGQGSQIKLSVVCDRCFLPFRTSLFMTTLMENSIVAQNTCLQMCVVGRDTFIGAGNTFTDYNLLAQPIKVFDRDKLVEWAAPVLGGCVGHNCRIGSGLVIYPARMIESDVILFASPERRVISKNVMYEDSDHLKLKDGVKKHPRKYSLEQDQW
jgi:carbonic anhydrase/acetyltransferase-like protein (isoleucine patch superfamily)